MFAIDKMELEEELLRKGFDLGWKSRESYESVKEFWDNKQEETNSTE